VVELALVLPLFLILLLGLAQVGLILNTQQQLVGVARQGARTYALGADPRSTVAAVRLAGRQLAGFDDRVLLSTEITDERGKAKARGSAGLLGRVGSTGGFPSAAVQKGAVRRGYWITVTVTYKYPNPIRASVLGFRLPDTITLSSSATARIEHDPTLPPAVPEAAP